MGKLYISPGSSEDKVRELYAEANAAVDDNLLTDATGRNALYKLHVSLGKIVNSYTEQDRASTAPRRTASRSVSAAPTDSVLDEDRTITRDDPTVVAVQPRIDEEATEDDGDMSVASSSRRGSVVDDILTDEGEMGQ